MDSLCRLCCSVQLVRNDIFDEANGLYTKISLYMPIKVFKNDELPQKICDKCSCKVNEFYQFCNEAIEIQNRLKAIWAASEGAQLPGGITALQMLQNHVINLKNNQTTVSVLPAPAAALREQATQTEEIKNTVRIKQEPRDINPTDAGTVYGIKYELNDIHIQPELIDYQREGSDDSDVCLVELQKNKKHKKKKIKNKDGIAKKKKSQGKKSKKLVNETPLESEELIVGKVEAVWSTGSAEEWSGDEADIKPWDVGALKIEDADKDAQPAVLYCCMCPAQYLARADLLQHYKEHETELEDSEKPEPPPPPPDGDPLRCQRCKASVEADQWAAHWARHWERDRRPLRCRLCERSFARARDVMWHGLKHRPEELAGGAGGRGGSGGSGAHQDLMCDHCPEKFTVMRLLLAHRTRRHPASLLAPLSLRCGRCGRVFAHANSLRRHLAAHEGRRDYLCYICGKSLSSKEHLKYHTRIHTGYKPHACQTCGKAFAKKCNLTLHERVHSGEKPHACPVCRKAFSQRSTLTIHQRYHSGERPYVCSLCGRGFVARGLLSMHLKTICV